MEGKENIPHGGVIFTSNHQNAMMDAMAIVAASGQKPWFMARADMFTSAFYRFFLGIFRIIPIYRQRDGKEGLKKNNDIFEQAATMLVKGHSLALFPEAGTCRTPQAAGFEERVCKDWLSGSRKSLVLIKKLPLCR
ncbi:MAG: 1-acyl-sn-glycerol-3-phosphate acyltransferase [Bacteroidales bacterium]|nr:1-acyl-sn-glycerol-3-phosphate acyltransferase [Bacteroidales bacterium]